MNYRSPVFPIRSESKSRLLLMIIAIRVLGIRPSTELKRVMEENARLKKRVADSRLNKTIFKMSCQKISPTSFYKKRSGLRGRLSRLHADPYEGTPPRGSAAAIGGSMFCASGKAERSVVTWSKSLSKKEPLLRTKRHRRRKIRVQRRSVLNNPLPTLPGA